MASSSSSSSSSSSGGSSSGSHGGGGSISSNLRERKGKVDYALLGVGETDSIYEQQSGIGGGGFRVYLETKLAAIGDSTCADSVQAENFTLDYVRHKGFPKPLRLLSSAPAPSTVSATPDAEDSNSPPTPTTTSNGLGMKIPHPRFNVRDVATVVGGDFPVAIIDVAAQSELHGWTMSKWAEYYHSPPAQRKKVLNLISLEFSGTPLQKLVRAPKVVRQIDWIDNIWPGKRRQRGEYPQVQFYCLMSLGDSWTDFHIDFGGTSVWYHVHTGKKVFVFVPPTPENLHAFEDWTTSPNQAKTWFPDTCPSPTPAPSSSTQQQQQYKAFSVTLEVGDTLIIPTGWIHAVFTPVDSLVFGGNFLHGYDMLTQLRIYELEATTKVPRKYRFPYYEHLHWYAAAYYTHFTRVNNFPRLLLKATKLLQEQEEKEEKEGETGASSSLEKNEAENEETKEEIIQSIHKIGLSLLEIRGLRYLIQTLKYMRSSLSPHTGGSAGSSPWKVPSTSTNASSSLKSSVLPLKPIQNLVNHHHQQQPLSDIVHAENALFSSSTNPDSLTTPAKIAVDTTSISSLSMSQQTTGESSNQSEVSTKAVITIASEEKTSGTMDDASSAEVSSTATLKSFSTQEEADSASTNKAEAEKSSSTENTSTKPTGESTTSTSTDLFSTTIPTTTEASSLMPPPPPAPAAAPKFKLKFKVSSAPPIRPAPITVVGAPPEFDDSPLPSPHQQQRQQQQPATTTTASTRPAPRTKGAVIFSSKSALLSFSGAEDEYGIFPPSVAAVEAAAMAGLDSTNIGLFSSSASAAPDALLQELEQGLNPEHAKERIAEADARAATLNAMFGAGTSAASFVTALSSATVRSSPLHQFPSLLRIHNPDVHQQTADAPLYNVYGFSKGEEVDHIKPIPASVAQSGMCMFGLYHGALPVFSGEPLTCERSGGDIVVQREENERLAEIVAQANGDVESGRVLSSSIYGGADTGSHSYITASTTSQSQNVDYESAAAAVITTTSTTTTTTKNGLKFVFGGGKGGSWSTTSNENAEGISPAHFKQQQQQQQRKQKKLFDDESDEESDDSDDDDFYDFDDDDDDDQDSEEEDDWKDDGRGGGPNDGADEELDASNEALEDELRELKRNGDEVYSFDQPRKRKSGSGKKGSSRTRGGDGKRRRGKQSGTKTGEGGGEGGASRGRTKRGKVENGLPGTEASAANAQVDLEALADENPEALIRRLARNNTASANNGGSRGGGGGGRKPNVGYHVNALLGTDGSNALVPSQPAMSAFEVSQAVADARAAAVAAYKASLAGATAAAIRGVGGGSGGGSNGTSAGAASGLGLGLGLGLNPDVTPSVPFAASTPLIPRPFASIAASTTSVARGGGGGGGGGGGAKPNKLMAMSAAQRLRMGMAKRR